MPGGAVGFGAGAAASPEVAGSIRAGALLDRGGAAGVQLAIDHAGPGWCRKRRRLWLAGFRPRRRFWLARTDGRAAACPGPGRAPPRTARRMSLLRRPGKPRG